MGECKFQVGVGSRVPHQPARHTAVMSRQLLSYGPVARAAHPAHQLLYAVVAQPQLLQGLRDRLHVFNLLAQWHSTISSACVRCCRHEPCLHAPPAAPDQPRQPGTQHGGDAGRLDNSPF